MTSPGGLLSKQSSEGKKEEIKVIQEKFPELKNMIFQLSRSSKCLAQE